MLNKTLFFRQSKIRADRRSLGIPYRKPLKTFLEIADMLGVSKAKLNALVRDPFAPRAKIKSKNSSTTINYYDADEFKKWFNTLPKEKNG